jgi:hypothetical protein
MFRKNESNKSQIITFHKNKLFALNDVNIKSRSWEMSLHNISKPTAWCISNSFKIMFWYSFLNHRLTYLLTYLRTYLLTPWSRVLLEKLIGSQLVKKFPVFYGTRRFIATFTSVRHLSLTWATSIQFVSPHSTFGRSMLILYSHLLVSLPRGLFPQVPHQKPVCTSSSPL